LNIYFNQIMRPNYKNGGFGGGWLMSRYLGDALKTVTFSKAANLATIELHIPQLFSRTNHRPQK
jgi:hypothetical protein